MDPAQARWQQLLALLRWRLPTLEADSVGDFAGP